MPTTKVEPSKVKLASSSNSPPVPAITTRLSVRSSTLSVFACAPALISSKPLVVVIPLTFTLSNSVCPVTLSPEPPEISAPPLASIAPVKVDKPDTFKLSISVVENVTPAPGAATPLIPVYLAPEIYKLFPVKLTPLGRFVPIKWRIPD